MPDPGLAEGTLTSFQKTLHRCAQNFCVERKSGMNRITGTPPSGITAAVLPPALPDSSIFLSFVKEFLNHEPISTLLIWTTEQPTVRAPGCSPRHHFSESLPRFRCYWVLRSLFTSILTSNFLLSFPGFLLPSRRKTRIPRLRCTSASSRHWVGHSGLSCDPPPYWHRLSAYSQAQLDQVALRLNQRPRKTLGFQTLRVNSMQVLR